MAQFDSKPPKLLIPETVVRKFKRQKASLQTPRGRRRGRGQGAEEGLQVQSQREVGWPSAGAWRREPSAGRGRGRAAVGGGERVSVLSEARSPPPAEARPGAQPEQPQQLGRDSWAVNANAQFGAGWPGGGRDGGSERALEAQRLPGSPATPTPQHPQGG